MKLLGWAVNHGSPFGERKEDGDGNFEIHEAQSPHQSVCFAFALGKTFQLEADLVSCCFPGGFIHISILPLAS